MYIHVCMYVIVFRLQEDPPAGVNGAPTDNNIMIWNAVIFGWVCALIRNDNDLFMADK